MGETGIALIYFSATDVTHAYAKFMSDVISDHNCKVHMFNVTPYAARQEKLPLGDFDGVIFGFPVFADFAPSVINEWLPTLDGNGRRCTQFFTYGGRSTGHAHFHTKTLLEQAGFQVLISAEFLGRHSFNVGGWHMLPNRPNEQDFIVAQEYIQITLERFRYKKPAILSLQKPFGYNHAIKYLNEPRKEVERSMTHPVRIETGCSMCHDCETECPTQAFDADAGMSNPETCIECMRCVYICPDKVIMVDKRMRSVYQKFLASWHLSEEMLEAKQSKIITDATQAVC